MHLLVFFALSALLGLVLGAPASSGSVDDSFAPNMDPMSDSDFQSFNLALNQEYIELDLLRHGLAQFSPQVFMTAGLGSEYRYLIEYMADQKAGHAQLISNLISPRGAKPCTYTYPFTTVRQFFDFCQRLMRWGESNVYGFVPHLDNQEPGAFLLNAIAIEARQQMIFRQFEGLFPMTVDFVASIPQAWAWTLLSPYLVSCPADNPRIEWQIFPTLRVVDNPNAINDTSQAAIATNVTAISGPTYEVFLRWDNPGQNVSYNNSYQTTTTAGQAKYALWVSQLNATYTPLFSTQVDCATTFQPGGSVFGEGSSPIWNDTMYIAITDDNPYVTPYNLSLVNSHIVAGPAIFQAG